MKFTEIERGARTPWGRKNNHYNPQSRGSLGSLRPSGAFIFRRCMAFRGVFRAVSPLLIAHGVEIALRVTAESSWGQPRVNVAVNVDWGWILRPMRHPAGRDCGISRGRHPRGDYLDREGSSVVLIPPPHTADSREVGKSPRGSGGYRRISKQ